MALPRRFFIFCWAVNLNLTWTYYFTGILIASSVIPIAVSILWARATSYAVISGVVGGAIAGMSVWLTLASTFEGGLSAKTFVKNTGEELPMLFGNITAIGMGAVFTIVVTFITRWKMTPEIEEEERTYAPPAIFILRDLHCQIPAATRFISSFPLGPVYFLCWETSIFLMSLRREAPYLVPYLPTIPAFLVLFAILSS